METSEAKQQFKLHGTRKVKVRVRARHIQIRCSFFSLSLRSPTWSNLTPQELLKTQALQTLLKIHRNSHCTGPQKSYRSEPVRTKTWQGPNRLPVKALAARRPESSSPRKLLASQPRWDARRKSRTASVPVRACYYFSISLNLRYELAVDER